MRRTTVIVLALILALAVVATAAPWQTIGYQGFLRDSMGSIVPDDDYELTFRIYEDETGSVLLWEETQTIAVEGGYIHAYIGSLEPLDPLTFDQQVPGLGSPSRASPNSRPAHG